MSTPENRKILFDLYGFTISMDRDAITVCIIYDNSIVHEEKYVENVRSKRFFESILTQNNIVCGIKVDEIHSFVEKGELLAKKIPATPGVEGERVNGEIYVPQPSKDIKMPAGKNVEITPDGNSMIAAVNGPISRTDKRISIVENFIIPGNLDYSTGNISFIGSVEVNGNLLSGFEIEANDDVLIRQLMEGAKIISGGNVIIQQGIQGNEKEIPQIKSNLDALSKAVNTLKELKPNSI